MRLKKRLTFCLLFILVSTTIGCQQDKQKEMITLTSYNSLIALNDLSVEISDLLNAIEKKDYIKADEIILTIHDTWDQLYPYAYISGLEDEMATSFTIDLNSVSEVIFSYSTAQKESEAETQAAKALIYLDSITAEKEMIQLQENTGNDNASDGNEQQSENNSSDKNDMEMMTRNKLSYQNSSLFQENNYQQLDQIILPEEVLQNTYPELTFNELDASAYVAAVQLTKHLAGFYNVINEANESRLMYMKYLCQDIQASAQLNDWDHLNEDINELTILWKENRLSTGDDTEALELVIKIDRNIVEIEEVSTSQNVDLIKVKCKVAIKNVEALLNK